MAIEHAVLTGSQVHEPKGVETAADGEVYVADGLGSGNWVDLLDSILNANTYVMSSRMDDASTASSVWFHVPIKSTLTRLNAMLYGAIDANTVLSIYINGVLFADSLTLLAAGSTAGQRHTVAIGTSNTITANSIVEVRSNGAATAAVKADVQLELTAIV